MKTQDGFYRGILSHGFVGALYKGIKYRQMKTSAVELIRVYLNFQQVSPNNFSLMAFHRILELFRVEKTFKTESSHSPSTAKSTTKPCPLVPHPKSALQKSKLAIPADPTLYFSMNQKLHNFVIAVPKTASSYHITHQSFSVH